MPILNIKDPKAHELASNIAQVTGKNLTRVVIEALEDRWQRVSRKPAKQQREDLLRLLDEWQKIPIADARSVDDLLYDKNGLPK